MRSNAVRSNLLVPMVREVMDIRQASDYLGISPDTLYKYASEGFVPAFKLGNRWRFKRSRLDEWMDRQSDMQAVDIDPEQRKPVRPALKKRVLWVRTARRLSIVLSQVIKGGQEYTCRTIGFGVSATRRTELEPGKA